MAQSDGELLALLATNLDGYFKQLVLSYQQRLYTFVLRQTGSFQDAEDIVQEAIANHSTTLTKHTISYRVDHANRPYMLNGDKDRLHQIFGNLLQNAIKYSPLGGPITVSISHIHRVDTDHSCNIEVCIEDKGIGVPKDAQPYLFERFFRAHNTGGTQTRGVGLGLYVVAEFLRLHNGTIRVESNGIVGEGSRFILTLPSLES